jgi:hypothetical protein
MLKLTSKQLSIRYLIAGFAFSIVTSSNALANQLIVGGQVPVGSFSYAVSGSTFGDEIMSSDPADGVLQLEGAEAYINDTSGIGAYVGAGLDGSSNISAASADIVYYFGIVGPAIGTSIPIDIAFEMDGASSGSGASTSAGLAFNAGCLASQPDCGDVTYNTGSLGGQVCSDGTVSACSQGVLNENSYLNAALIAYSGFAYPVEITAKARVYNPDGAPGEGWTSVDPMFSIDPSFASVDPNYSTDYTLVFSAGVDNELGASISPVAEPSTLALDGTGFLALFCSALVHRRVRSRKSWVS